jgi:hypothetical protein
MTSTISLRDVRRCVIYRKAWCTTMRLYAKNSPDTMDILAAVQAGIAMGIYNDAGYAIGGAA